MTGVSFQALMMGGGSPASISFIGTTDDSTNQTTYTFAGAAIGAADATRRVVVAFHWYSTGISISSATIGGVSATIHAQVQSSPGTNGGHCGLLSALVPTGTTATIAVTLSGAATRAEIGVFRAINETVASPFAMATDATISSGHVDPNVNTGNGGWVICCAGLATNGATGATAAFTGVTEDYDAPSAESATRLYSGGHANAMTGETPRTITVTFSGTDVNTEASACAMSWI